MIHINRYHQYIKSKGFITTTTTSIIHSYLHNNISTSLNNHTYIREYARSSNGGNNRSKNIIKGLNYKSIGSQHRSPSSSSSSTSYKLSDDTIINHKITSRSKGRGGGGGIEGGPKKYLDEGTGWGNVTFHQGELSPEKLRELQEERQDLIDYNRKIDRKREIRKDLKQDKYIKGLMGNKSANKGEIEEEEEEDDGVEGDNGYDDGYDEDKDYGEDDDEYEEGEENKDPSKFEFGKLKTKTFIKEEYTIMKPNQKQDEEFVRKQLSDDGFEKDLAEEDGWREYDESKGGIQGKKFTYEDEETKAFAKRGLIKKGGSIYCEGFQIEEKYLKYFMNPDHVEGKGRRGGLTRVEKRRLRAKQEAGLAEDFKKKDKKKRKVIFDHENMEEHTILQKRMADRIMNILNDSFLFKDHAKRYHSMIADYQHDTTDQSVFGFFKNHKDEYMEEDELFDPILSKVHISLTRTKVSSDLKWLKIYWARDVDNIDNAVEDSDNLELSVNEDVVEKELDDDDDDDIDEDDLDDDELDDDDNNNMDAEDEIELDQDKEEDAEDDVDEEFDDEEFGEQEEEKDIKQTAQQEEEQSSVNDSPLPEILEDLSTFKAKQVMIKRLQDTLPEERAFSKAQTHGQDNIVTSKSYRPTSLLSKQTNNKNNPNNNNNNNNKINNNAFSFGKFGNEINTEEVEFKLKIPEFDSRLTVSTPKVGNDEDLVNAQKRRVSQYEAITDEQIQNRLVKLTPRLRAHIAKNIKTRYIPNLYFVLDKNKKKQEASIDIFENIIAPEMLEAAKQSRNRKAEKSSQFMGVFNNQNSVGSAKRLDESTKYTIPGYSEENESSLYMDNEIANDVIKEELIAQGFEEEEEDDDDTFFGRQQKQYSKQFIHKKYQQPPPERKELETDLDKEAEANRQFFKDFNKGIFNNKP